MSDEMSPTSPVDIRLFGDAVRDLWRLAQEVSPEDFQAEALRVVGRLLSFDACFWGMASSESEGSLLQPHHVHIDRLPGEALLEYDTIASVDVVAQFIRAHPGRTLHFDTRTAGPDVPPEVLAFDARHGIEQILCTMVLEPLPQVATVISLYRSPGRTTFSEEERALVEALVPHLVAAFAACRTRGLPAAGAGEAAEIAAVADTRGRLYTSSPALEELLGREWRGFRGPTLPGPLKVLCLEGGVYRGGAVVVQVEPPRSSFTRIFARPVAPADRLSDAEREIALAFSMGMEAAEIATLAGLSVAGVRNRLRQAYATLGVSSRVELVAALSVLRKSG